MAERAMTFATDRMAELWMVCPVCNLAMPKVHWPQAGVEDCEAARRMWPNLIGIRTVCPHSGCNGEPVDFFPRQQVDELVRAARIDALAWLGTEEAVEIVHDELRRRLPDLAYLDARDGVFTLKCRASEILQRLSHDANPLPDPEGEPDGTT